MLALCDYLSLTEVGPSQRTTPMAQTGLQGNDEGRVAVAFFLCGAMSLWKALLPFGHNLVNLEICTRRYEADDKLVE